MSHCGDTAHVASQRRTVMGLRHLSVPEGKVPAWCAVWSRRGLLTTPAFQTWTKVAASVAAIRNQ